MSKPRLNRNVFIRVAALVGIGAGMAYLEKITQPIGAVRFILFQARSKYQQHLGPRAVVSLVECPSYQENIARKLGEFWEQAGMPAVTGKKVLVKPNLVDTVEGTLSITAPEVVLAVVDLLQEMGASQVVVGDGPAFRREALGIIQAIGLADGLNKRGVPFIDLNYDDPLPRPANRDWFLGIREVWLPRHAVEADLIVSVPKMKTHHWAGLSLSMKNLLGLLPGCRYGWPKNFIHFRGITASILGLVGMLPPVVSVVDGVVGMEGDGPLFGTPVPHGLLVMGADPVAVDITCARLMGFQMEEVEYLNIAAYSGAGQFLKIDTLGASVEAMTRSYQRPPSI